MTIKALVFQAEDQELTLQILDAERTGRMSPSFVWTLVYCHCCCLRGKGQRTAAGLLKTSERRSATEFVEIHPV